MLRVLADEGFSGPQGCKGLEVSDLALRFEAYGFTSKLSC